MKRVRVRMLRTVDRYEQGSSPLLGADVANLLVASGAAVELFEIKPSGPTEFKPIQPSEVKQEFSGKKKVKTRKS